MVEKIKFSKYREYINDYEHYLINTVAGNLDEKKVIKKAMELSYSYQIIDEDNTKGAKFNFPFFRNGILEKYCLVAILEDEKGNTVLNDLESVFEYWHKYGIKDYEHKEKIQNIKDRYHIYDEEFCFQFDLRDVTDRHSVGKSIKYFLDAVIRLQRITWDDTLSFDMRENECRTYFKIVGDFNVQKMESLLKEKSFSHVNKGDMGVLVKLQSEKSSASFGLCNEYDRDVNVQILKTLQPFLNKIDLLVEYKKTHNIEYILIIAPTLIVNNIKQNLSLNEEVIKFCYETGTKLSIDLKLCNGENEDI